MSYFWSLKSHLRNLAVLAISITFVLVVSWLDQCMKQTQCVCKVTMSIVGIFCHWKVTQTHYVTISLTFIMFISWFDQIRNETTFVISITVLICGNFGRWGVTQVDTLRWLFQEDYFWMFHYLTIYLTKYYVLAKLLC